MPLEDIKRVWWRRRCLLILNRKPLRLSGGCPPYAYGRMKKYTPADDIHNGADICTDSAHCQAWIKKGGCS